MEHRFVKPLVILKDIGLYKDDRLAIFTIAIFNLAIFSGSKA